MARQCIYFNYSGLLGLRKFIVGNPEIFSCVNLNIEEYFIWSKHGIQNLLFFANNAEFEQLQSLVFNTMQPIQ